MSDYDKQARGFLDRFGLAFSAKYESHECPPFCTPQKTGHKMLPCGGVHGGKYMVTIERANGQSFTFPFWNSYASEYGPGDDAYQRRTKAPGRRDTLFWEDHFSKAGGSRRSLADPPKAYDVLSCISSDAVTDDFEEWCADYGYDVDSRKAYAQWESCRDFSYKILRFFTTDEITALQEIQ